MIYWIHKQSITTCMPTDVIIHENNVFQLCTEFTFLTTPTCCSENKLL